MYQIVHIAPTYCGSTDGIIGSHIVSRSHAYQTVALALKLASMKSHDAYASFGEDSFVVVPSGRCPFQRSNLCFGPSEASADEMPF